MMDEFSEAKRASKKVRRIIAQKCPSHAKYCVGPFAGRYFRITRRRIVFVLTATPGLEKIITVFDISC